MASSTTTAHERYKLPSVFHGDTVVHTTYTSDLNAGQRRVKVKTSWKREKELGSGAFGVVWRQREAGGKLRAVKIISKLHLNLREVEALIQLQDHPDLFILFLGWFEDPHAIHIAMEYIEHGDLGQYIDDHAAKAKAEAKEVTSQLLQGLVVLHERQICHRDLKPQNILIAALSPIWVKITDFGISKHTVGTSLRSGCGTVCYQAPEQLGLLPIKMRVGASYTQAVDIWALGAVVHQILTSEIPFLEKCQDLDWLTVTPGLYTTNDFVPTIDSELLFNYCHGSSDFPTERLQENGVSKHGIDFVKGLMVPNPTDRVSATDALNSLWFIPEIEPDLLRTQLQLLGLDISPENANLLCAEEDRAVITEILHAPAFGQIWGLLCAAVAMGYLEAVKILLKLVDDIDACFEPNNLSLLQVGSGHGQALAMQLILDRGAKIDASRNGQTALSAAAGSGDLNAMKLLLDSGATVDWAPRDHDGQTALHTATVSGHLDAMKLLLDRGGDVNAASTSENGQTALHAAATSGNLDAIKLLLDRGAGVNTSPTSQNGQTALHAAAMNGHLDAMKLLFGSGADVNAAATSQNGQTALHAAALTGHLDAMDLLLDSGAGIDTSATSENAQTALHAAAANGHIEGLKRLLDRGANINEVSTSQNGQTALHAAATSGDLDAVKLLLDSGADANTGSSRQNSQAAWQAAAASGHLDVMKLLLDRGSDFSGESAARNAQPISPGAVGYSQTPTHLGAINTTLSTSYVSLAGKYEREREQLAMTTKELSELQASFSEAQGINDKMTSQLTENASELHLLRVTLAKVRDEVAATKDIPGNARGIHHFSSSCQQLFNSVKIWCNQFSSFSPGKKCNTVHRITDEATRDRVEGVMLDDRGVRRMLKDERRRSEVFIAITMRMIWEHVFSRYLFGLDVDERQKMLSLERSLGEIGDHRALQQWRAASLTMLSARHTFASKRAADAEVVVDAIFVCLRNLLPPPPQFVALAGRGLRTVVQLAVQLAVEMRTERSEYVMKRPPRPEYDDNGDVMNHVPFRASIMQNQGTAPIIDRELEMEGATVKMILFPHVIRRGNDCGGDYDREVTVLPMLVLVNRPQLSFEAMASNDRVSPVWRVEQQLAGVSRLEPITEHTPRDTLSATASIILPRMLPMIPEQTIRLVPRENAVDMSNTAGELKSGREG